MIRFTLPVPPSANKLYAPTAKFGGRRLTADMTAYRALCLWEILRQGVPRDKTQARLAVSLIYHPADKRESDIDNRLKAPLDAMQHAGVFANDSQIDDLRIVRLEPIPNGRLEVTITELDS